MRDQMAAKDDERIGGENYAPPPPGESVKSPQEKRAMARSIAASEGAAAVEAGTARITEAARAMAFNHPDVVQLLEEKDALIEALEMQVRALTENAVLNGQLTINMKHTCYRLSTVVRHTVVVTIGWTIFMDGCRVPLFIKINEEKKHHIDDIKINNNHMLSRCLNVTFRHAKPRNTLHAGIGILDTLSINLLLLLHNSTHVIVGQGRREVSPNQSIKNIVSALTIHECHDFFPCACGNECVVVFRPIWTEQAPTNVSIGTLHRLGHQQVVSCVLGGMFVEDNGNRFFQGGHTCLLSFAITSVALLHWPCARRLLLLRVAV